MKKLILILSLFISLFSFAQSGLTEAEDFLVKDVTGVTHTLYSYLEQDKIVVASFFTTTCGSCNIYTPEIVESYEDFGCNEGDVVYMGINWGADNIGVTDFMAVHSVEYPCASGSEGLGDQVNEQYEIMSHITALIILPDGTIAGQFYGPNAYPTRDSLNNLLQQLGAHMQSCGVGIQEQNQNEIHISVSGEHELLIEPGNILSGNYQIDLLDIQGHQLISENIYLQSGNDFRFSLPENYKGVLIVNIQNGTSFVYRQKILRL
jgi:thiol-disulfide isomerase/thioredoxin